MVGVRELEAVTFEDETKPPGMGRSILEAVLIAGLSALATGVANKLLEAAEKRRKAKKKGAPKVAKRR